MSKTIKALQVEDALDPVSHSLAVGVIYAGPARKVKSRCGLWIVTLPKGWAVKRPRCPYCAKSTNHPDAEQ